MFNGDRSAKYPNEQDMVHEGKLILTQWSSLWTFYFLKMRNFILQRAYKFFFIHIVHYKKVADNLIQNLCTN